MKLNIPVSRSICLRAFVAMLTSLFTKHEEQDWCTADGLLVRTTSNKTAHRSPSANRQTIRPQALYFVRYIWCTARLQDCKTHTGTEANDVI